MESVFPGEQSPSTEWPIQRFVWTDYQVRFGDEVSYMIVPMLWENDALRKGVAFPCNWTTPVTVGTGTDYQAYFNKGIIYSQFMSRQVQSLKATDHKASLVTTVEDIDSPIRKFLGGKLVQQLFEELEAVEKNKNTSIYTALYELSGSLLIEQFKAIGDRCNMILANGAFSGKEDNDENGEVRKDLQDNSTINLFDRHVNGKHFAHNKFIVFCENDKPVKVWTGSTNLSENGMYTQVNNACLINDQVVAAWYLDEWNEIKKEGNSYPAEYLDFNSKGHPVHKDITTWLPKSINEEFGY